MKTARIADIKRFAVHDGPGIRTTVFLKGCPLRCVWCHNPECISFGPELAFFRHKCLNCGECAPVCAAHAHRYTEGKHTFDRASCAACGKCADVCAGEALTLYGKVMNTDAVLKTILEDKPFYDESGGGLTVSGGEPLAQHEFIAELLLKAKRAGLHTAVDTCGEAGEDALRPVIPYTDLFLYDLKQTDSAAHRILTGRGNERILHNLRLLCIEQKQVEIRMPFIPGMNDSEENLRAAGSFLASMPNITRVTLLPYNGMARSKYAALGKSDSMPETAAPPAAALESAAVLLRSFGLSVSSGQSG